MYRTIALATALAVFAMLPANPATAADLAELIREEHYSVDGYEVDLYVTRGVDGDILSEATITDPATGDTVDVWTEAPPYGGSARSTASQSRARCWRATSRPTPKGCFASHPSRPSSASE